MSKGRAILRSAELNDPSPRLIRAQAALWVTRLHGPDRNATLEADCRRWLKEDPRHAKAFELATDAWLMSANIAPAMPARRWPGTNHSTRHYARFAAAAAILLCCVLASSLYLRRESALVTGPGEQKALTLSDGTVVTLNANSHLLVKYDDQLRRVVLTAGEANFHVTKHQGLPFDVVIGARKVVALGTSFQVRREDPTGDAFAVTLLEGRVAVEPLSLPDTVPLLSLPEIKVLNPGERLKIQNDSETLDTPSLVKVTAWQHGQLIFEDTSLIEATAEFNRYGKDKITLSGPRVGSIRVGGVFRIGDPAAFAQVIARTHHLQVVQRGREIQLLDASATAP